VRQFSSLHNIVATAEITAQTTQSVPFEGFYLGGECNNASRLQKPQEELQPFLQSSNHKIAFQPP